MNSQTVLGGEYFCAELAHGFPAVPGSVVAAPVRIDQDLATAPFGADGGAWRKTCQDKGVLSLDSMAPQAKGREKSEAFEVVGMQ